MERGRSSKISHPADWSPGRSAPDGGWGWIVVVAVGFIFIVTIGPMGSFGLIFGNFLESIGAGTSDVTFINGLYFALSFLPGVLANRVLQLYTCRQVVLVGGILFFFGSFLSAFANSVAFMVITFGVIQGTGLGLLLPASFTCLNKYFLRRRTQAMGAAQLLVAVGVVLYPLLIEALMESVGFRGTQAILAALSLHTIVGALTMQSLDISTAQRLRKVKLLDSDKQLDNILSSPQVDSGRKCTRIRIEEEGEEDLNSSGDVYYYKERNMGIEQDIPEVDETTVEENVIPDEGEKQILLVNKYGEAKTNIIRSDSEKCFSSESAVNKMLHTAKTLTSPHRTHSFESINPTGLSAKPAGNFQILDYFHSSDPTLFSIKSLDITRKDSITLSRQMCAKPILNPNRSCNYQPENTTAFNKLHFRKRKISDNKEKQHKEPPHNLVSSENPNCERGVERLVMFQSTPEDVEKSAGSLCNGPGGHPQEDMKVAKVQTPEPGSRRDDTEQSRHSQKQRPSRRQTEYSRRRPSVMTTISACSSSDSMSFGSSDDSFMNPPRRQRKYSVVSWTADCMDLGLLRDPVYVNIILGVSFSIFSDNMFLNLQPLFYHELGFTGAQAAACVAINSAADLFGRVGFVLFGACLSDRSRPLFLLGSAGTVLVRTMFLLGRDYATISALTALLGFFRSWVNVCTPLVFAEYVPMERFPAAYGLYLLTAGLVHLLLGPFVGLIRDVSGSYPTCLAAITALMMVCIVPWTLECVLLRSKRTPTTFGH